MSEANFTYIGSNQTYLPNSSKPFLGILIAFQLGRLLSFLCIIFGIIGNTALIFVLIRSSFHRCSHGSLLLFIASFDILRLLATSFYYLFFEDLISLNLTNLTIYIVIYRYPKNVTNWLKVLLAVDRLMAVKFWLTHRQNIHSNMTISRQQRRVMWSICILLVCSLISQHPNFLGHRFLSFGIDRTRFMIITKVNPVFHYGNLVYNGGLYAIASYILLDDLLPVTMMILLNLSLLYRLRRLPVMTSRKLSESIRVLFFLTICSVFVAPRSFIFLFEVYINSNNINRMAIAILFHTLQGFEMANHAMTGYMCFLSCRDLRNTFLDSVRKVQETLRNKRSMTNSLPTISLSL